MSSPKWQDAEMERARVKDKIDSILQCIGYHLTDGELTILESALTAALDRGRVVEVERCDGGDADEGGCPAEYDMISCRIHDKFCDSWTHVEGCCPDPTGEGPIPKQCPLRAGPVTLAMKKEGE